MTDTPESVVRTLGIVLEDLLAQYEDLNRQDPYDQGVRMGLYTVVTAVIQATDALGLRSNLGLSDEALTKFTYGEPRAL